MASARGTNTPMRRVSALADASEPRPPTAPSSSGLSTAKSSPMAISTRSLFSRAAVVTCFTQASGMSQSLGSFGTYSASPMVTVHAAITGSARSATVAGWRTGPAPTFEEEPAKSSPSEVAMKACPFGGAATRQASKRGPSSMATSSIIVLLTPVAGFPVTLRLATRSRAKPHFVAGFRSVPCGPCLMKEGPLQFNAAASDVLRWSSIPSVWRPKHAITSPPVLQPDVSWGSRTGTRSSSRAWRSCILPGSTLIMRLGFRPKTFTCVRRRSSSKPGPVTTDSASYGSSPSKSPERPASAKLRIIERAGIRMPVAFTSRARRALSATTWCVLSLRSWIRRT
mmetsp:Transcript_43281/g.139065  ORF Transcript_43281/g.139065 Transcript_43281/m.139065 type:complete len:340 (-) Transcript_43281:1130-2149(-)